MTSIYGLYDPRDGVCRYVGKTIKPLAERLRGHVNDARRRKHSVRRFSWVLSLLDAGVMPAIKLLEKVSDGRWADAERKWIAKFRADGIDLINTTDGGEGCDGMRHSEETRIRMSASAKRVQSDPEIKAKISASLKKAYESPERRAALSAALKKSHNRPEVRARLSAANKGKWRPGSIGHVVSAEARAKIGAAQRGIPQPSDAVAKTAAWHRGRKRSAETRARQSAAAILREQRKRMTHVENG